MPHSGYKDEDVSVIYHTLDNIIEKARKQRHLVITGGDWNAEVGGRQEGGDINSVGMHGQGYRNARGDMFAKWSTNQELCIANTMSWKRWDVMWTHVHAGRKRIIHYLCIDSKIKQWLRDAATWPALDLGSDHRATFIALVIPARSGRRVTNKKRRNRKGWKPTNADAYQISMDAAVGKLQDRQGRASDNDVIRRRLEQRCMEIEEVIVEIAQTEQRLEEQQTKERLRLSEREKKNLIQERRRLRADGATDARQMQKVQKGSSEKP
jgi:hypothetical protein